jgi:hypothetical protein
MQFPILVGIAIVPFKTSAAFERIGGH